jgi:hypothetical protein
LDAGLAAVFFRHGRKNVSARTAWF